jgi:hypothetical protein
MFNRGFVATEGIFKRSRCVCLHQIGFVFHPFHLTDCKFSTSTMVYIHIPDTLTEEEQMLMAKYAKLKKKVRKKN